jgi:long-chain acyl-CoA synthetase
MGDRRYPVSLKNITNLQTLITSIDDTLKGHIAFISPGSGSFERMDYPHVKESTAALIRSLQTLGVAKGDKIALLSENRSEWALVYLAAVSMGAIIVPLDILLTPEEINNLLKDSQPKVSFLSASQKNRFSQPEELPVSFFVLFDPIDETKHIQEKNQAQNLISQLLSLSILPKKIQKTILEHKENLFLTDNGELLIKNERFHDFTTLIEAGKQIITEGCEESSLFPPLSSDDPAALIYTSGTTGKPKGVLLSHGNLASNVHDIQMLEPFSPNYRWVTLLPLHHTFPTIGGLLVPFFTRGTIRFVASLRTDVIISAFKETRVTSTIIVPLFLEKIYKNILKTVSEKIFSFAFFSRACFTSLAFSTALLTSILARFSFVVFGISLGLPIFASSSVVEDLLLKRSSSASTPLKSM